MEKSWCQPRHGVHCRKYPTTEIPNAAPAQIEIGRHRHARLLTWLTAVAISEPICQIACHCKVSYKLSLAIKRVYWFGDAKFASSIRFHPIIHCRRAKRPVHAATRARRWNARHHLRQVLHPKRPWLDRRRRHVFRAPAERPESLDLVGFIHRHGESPNTSAPGAPFPGAQLAHYSGPGHEHPDHRWLSAQDQLLFCAIQFGQLVLARRRHRDPNLARRL